ncbi:hypothetical protein C6P41_004707 [Kluyveromyces marxianus]|nr:hypothetical protein C6P43_004878 [Kluyveromyces marxianus]KAG0680898.1 hypothetical protein C6P41_004707 [Kluyveromyces marxianus]
MIWTYEMDLALCKLVYMNSPEILIEGIRDRSKNYHSVLNEFNKQFRLQVKQPRTVRARFERLLLDYKSRAKTKFAPKGRESEIDMLMKTLVTMEAEYYENNKLPVSRPSSVESINVLTSGAMMEKAIDALKEVSQDELGAKNAAAATQISPKLKDITKSQNTLRSKKSSGTTNSNASGTNTNDWSNDNEENNIFANYASSGRSFGTKKGINETKNKYQDSMNGDNGTSDGNLHENDDDDNDEDEDEDEDEYSTPTLQPKLKKVRHNTVPESQPFTITNYFSDNKTFIMNGDGGTQQWAGKSDLHQVTQRVQGDLENVKHDVQELSVLSKRIAAILDRVTGMDSTGTSNNNGAHTASLNGTGTGNGNSSPNSSPE